MKEISWETKGRLCSIQFANELILNGQNQDLLVNYLEYMEVDPDTAEIIYFNASTKPFKKPSKYAKPKRLCGKKSDKCLISYQPCQ